MCHECARQSIASAGVGQCRFCLVSLCKDHLVESLSDAVPRYACDHRPDLPFDSTAAQTTVPRGRLARTARSSRAAAGA